MHGHKNRDFQCPYRVLYETWLYDSGTYLYMEIRRSKWPGTGFSQMQNLKQSHCINSMTCRMVCDDQAVMEDQRTAITSFLKNKKDGSNTCPSPRKGPSVTTSALPGNIKIAAVAGEDIPPGIFSPSISASNPMDVNTVFWNDGDVDYFVEVTLDEGQTLTSLNENWMKHVRLARHCHMQNVQIIPSSNGGLCLQSINAIKKGEPLFAWFGLETAKSFEIPFLTLNNIKGGHHYCCHNCCKVFEDPNPLKIHIALLCPGSSLNLSPNTNREENLGSTAPYQDACRAAISVAPVRPTTSSENVPLVVGNYSAFRPLKQHERTTHESSLFRHSNPKFVPNGTISALPNFSINYATLSDINLTAFQNFRPAFVPGSRLSYFQMSPSIDLNANFSSAPNVMGYHAVPTSAFTYLHNASGTVPPSGDHLAAEAFPTNPSPNPNLVHSEGQSETQANVGGIISEQFTTSDGKSKRRHKCFYCSKMYSRKYGLKIHIRTHLNYKPLSCKVCQRRFADPSNLNKHIRLHAEGVTPYRCDFCGKVLVRRRDLERHLKSRHPQIDTAVGTTAKLKTENNIEDNVGK